MNTHGCLCIETHRRSKTHKDLWTSINSFRHPYIPIIIHRYRQKPKNTYNTHIDTHRHPEPHRHPWKPIQTPQMREKSLARLSTARVIPKNIWCRHFAKTPIPQTGGRSTVTRADNSQNFLVLRGSSMGLCFQISSSLESTYRASPMNCCFRSAYLTNCQFFMFFTNNSVKNFSTLRFDSSKERGGKNTSNDQIISRVSRDMRLYNPQKSKNPRHPWHLKIHINNHDPHKYPRTPINTHRHPQIHGNP